ncbi:COPI associated protein-domain-containing protein [Mucor lusitanicus]|uniref:COPI associated protein n=2 Tax=Mucor circinelloides f. lusitanicus TaxID=29924 RepID=A0A168JBL6_MUCCL|nr:COPI associated protein-domain-containing protein [Mucor lusitanicus]OAD00996.1 hypothetical protein MUCCIDRAFT_112422 [Mucor lusitanicus CBS 277.49]
MASKTKLENIYGLVFNAINLSLYLLAAAASLMKAIVEHSSVSQVLTCVYAFILSLVLVVMESKSCDMAVYYFKFLTLYRGRAMLVIFIILGNSEHSFLLAAGILNLMFGLLYLVLSFIPQTPIPRPVYDNWQNWKEYSAEGLDLERPANDSNMMDNAARLKMSMLEKPQQSKINPV